MLTAILVGANDAAGKRIRYDLEQRLWRVLSVSVADRANDEDTLNPMQEDSIKRAALSLSEHSADMLIINIDRPQSAESVAVLNSLSDNALIEDYEYGCVGVLRVLHAFFPLLDAGKGKRICLVTTKEGSQSLCKATDGYGRRMAKASLNMAMKLLFNELRPDGYTFRMYCKEGDAKPGAYAAEYFTRDRSNEPENPPHSDENRFVLHDSYGGEVPW
jgi:hypothetical protein